MFSRANTKPTPAAPAAQTQAPERKPERRTAGESAPERVVPSIVSADLTVTGDLVSAGEIQIDGRVEGDIKCASLIIGIAGAVTGEVSAQTVRMHGSVSGQVIAKSVFLASTARMIGDVTHESLAIEPGAFLEGHCRRMTEMPDLSLPDRNAAVAEAAEAKPRLASSRSAVGEPAAAGGAGAKTDESGTEPVSADSKTGS
ncbi:bactofilin family protein [Roseospira goensis]|uniref:Cytoskeletal protein CcmA (Bactofilin family) n=1 Tax=Roseospira goensis TaxID=391922 RepID=A0A7W6RXC6_9PROT|nr:polymer-forming cytoskeletal protein [Roseospira goensis]MBB4284963.1 cytoskeletal protein CcmA (bactofilin family) [Roseospira goensis]